MTPNAIKEGTKMKDTKRAISILLVCILVFGMMFNCVFAQSDPKMDIAKRFDISIYGNMMVNTVFTK